jgi:phosphoribosylaminoimidazole carboxylase (NCAIR synthetase)
VAELTLQKAGRHIMNKNLQGKKLLLLGGAAQHCKVVEAAKEMGVYVICTDPLINSPAKKIADKSYMFDVKDVDALTELCQREHVDGVLNVCLDPCQIPYQQICKILNYPCFGDVNQFSVLTDKRKFKKFCIENGVGVVPEYKINDFDDENSNIAYPVLVKPVDSRGSRGQTICNNIDEIRAAIPVARKESSNGEVLFEKYMGRENDMILAYMVIEGEPYLLRMSDRYLGKQEDGLEKVAVAAITPSNFTEFYLNNADRNVKKMIKNLGIKNGPVFMQGFVDGDTVRFYDPGLRLPGSEFEVSYKKICKIDVVKMLIEFALTGSIPDSENITDHIYLDGHFSISLHPTVRAGIIQQIKGLDTIKHMDNVVAFSQRYHEGDEVFQTNDVRQRFCSVDLIAPSLNHLKASIELIQDALKVLDKDGNNLIYGKFETSRI